MKIPYATEAVTNISLCWRSNVSFSILLLFTRYELRGLTLSAVTVLLLYLP